MGLPDLSGYNDHQLVAWVIGAFFVTLCGLIHLVVKVHSTDRNAKAANEQTINTGNGFAQRVKDDLTEIKIALGEFREESRANEARIERRLDDHMNNHDRRNNA